MDQKHKLITGLSLRTYHSGLSKKSNVITQSLYSTALFTMKSSSLSLESYLTTLRTNSPEFPNTISAIMATLTD